MNTADGNAVGSSAGGTDFIQLAALAVSAASAYAANRSARKEAASNRAFQADMSSTAHQREVRDLRAAGLNPILSATGGAGASTPSGAVAPVVQPDVVGSINSGLAAKRQKELLKHEAEIMKENVHKAYADARKASTEDEIARQVFRHNAEMMPQFEATARAQASQSIYQAYREGLGYGVDAMRYPIEEDIAAMETSPGAKIKRRVDYYGGTVGKIAGTALGTFSAGKIASMARAYRNAQKGRRYPSGPVIRGYKAGRPPAGQPLMP